jgi:multicomponent Na+:H+ antiporter subunit F
LAEWPGIVALTLASLGVLLASIRLFRGPTAADRAVALDVLTLIFTPAMVGFALFADRAIYLDVALVYALLSFLGVIALARFLDRGL